MSSLELRVTDPQRTEYGRSAARVEAQRSQAQVAVLIPPQQHPAKSVDPSRRLQSCLRARVCVCVRMQKRA